MRDEAKGEGRVREFASLGSGHMMLLFGSLGVKKKIVNKINEYSNIRNQIYLYTLRLSFPNHRHRRNQNISQVVQGDSVNYYAATWEFCLFGKMPLRTIHT